MTTLDMLIKRLEQELNDSPAEACERLIGAMGVALTTSLGAIKMGSELLKAHTEALQAQQWADTCYQQSLQWLDDYRKIIREHRDQPPTSCQGVLQAIENLFTNSLELLAQGEQLSVEEKLAGMRDITLQHLVTVSQIHTQLQAKDLSWLLPHVIGERLAIEVRLLQPGDEQLALKVVRGLVPEAERAGREPSLPHLQRFLGQETNYLIVALMSSAPVAFLTAYRVPALAHDASMVYLFEIEVAPAHRRRGIGKRMIDLLKGLCQDSGVEIIWVGTENDNIAAKRLYESTGGICAYPDSCEFIYDLTVRPELSMEV